MKTEYMVMCVLCLIAFALYATVMMRSVRHMPDELHRLRMFVIAVNMKKKEERK